MHTGWLVVDGIPAYRPVWYSRDFVPTSGTMRGRSQVPACDSSSHSSPATGASVLRTLRSCRMASVQMGNRGGSERLSSARCFEPQRQSKVIIYLRISKRELFLFLARKQSCGVAAALMCWACCLHKKWYPGVCRSTDVCVCIRGWVEPGENDAV